MIKAQELLNKTKIILENEGELDNVDKLSNDTILKDFVLPGLKNSKDVLSSIYSFQSRSRGGFLGKIKTLLQNKIILTVINVIERQSMKQQKFNELTYKAIEALVEENRIQKEKLHSLDIINKI